MLIYKKCYKLQHMINIDDKILPSLGLSPMQAKVYLAALELGEATIQALSRKSGVNRSTIYTFIEELKTQGYILETRRKKRRIYSAIHPERLVEIQKSRVSELEGMLPELLAINNQSAKKPRVTYYEGKKGIEDIYADMLRDRKEILAYEDLDNLKAGLSESFFEYFPKERARRNIIISSISRDTPFARKFSKHNMGLLRKTRFISAAEFKTDINIYGNKVAMMNLRGKPPFCVLIEDHFLADTMRIIWQQLWDQLGATTE